VLSTQEETAQPGLGAVQFEPYAREQVVVDGAFWSIRQLEYPGLGLRDEETRRGGDVLAMYRLFFP
jgi:hypothetical protein